ncbi:2Fe-2S iron-sulfur cluster-binding protein [Streptomyces sp. Da 82-17]|uniref:2Fe-2S iron-sulfur cluster-binding protein n=1 Tax=Streptomyces sp. Da 82-17 TaxID=3377116 RepID=UPI0038D42970
MLVRRGVLGWGQFLFGVFCVAAAVVLGLRDEGVFAGLQTAGVVGYALAGPVVAAAGWALGRPGLAARARTALIVFHLAFVPLQFLFSFGNFEPLAGMVLSTVFLVLLKPRFPRLSRRTRKIWLAVHIGAAVSWLGLSLAMTVMAIAGLTTDTHAVRHGAYELMHLFDLALVIPGMALAVVSGIVLSLGTPWGLVKHWWVLVKLVIALALPVFAAFAESKWIRELQRTTQDPAAEPGGTGVALVVCLATFTVLLGAAVVLSVFKPGGRTPAGRRAEHRTEHRTERWGERTTEHKVEHKAERAAERGARPARTAPVVSATRATPASPAAAVSPTAPAVPAGGRSSWTPVVVGEVRELADRVVELELWRAEAGRLPAWQPGAHIDLALPSGKVRQYSLCGDPGADDATDVYRIAVLREEDGRGGSAEVHALRTGAAVEIRGPRNNFPLVDAPSYLFVAGGIGVTPFLPMIRRLESEGAPWRLYYRGRTRAAMAFADELVETYPGRVIVTASDTHPRASLDGLLRATAPGVAVYCCGPGPMQADVAAAVRASCPHGRLYVERFVPGDRADAGPDRAFEAELRRSGGVVRVAADESLLDALSEAAPALDFSCTNGICGSCETRVLDGTPDHRDDVLQEHERNRHDVIYPCVSRARGDRIALDL